MLRPVARKRAPVRDSQLQSCYHGAAVHQRSHNEFELREGGRARDAPPEFRVTRTEGLGGPRKRSVRRGPTVPASVHFNKDSERRAIRTRP